MLPVQEIRYKLRYNPLPRLVINALKRIGLTVLPYYVLRRSLASTARPVDDPTAALVDLGPDDMPAIADMPMANSPAREFARRLADGHRCFGLQLDGELVGYCWMDPAKCSFPGEGFRLEPGAAYAYDVYTLPSRRGQNLAPLLNALFSQRLIETGFHTVYSTIDYYNHPSLRFAGKIGARRVRLNLYLGLFGLARFSWCLRRDLETA